jgi:hypothetical protein
MPAVPIMHFHSVHAPLGLGGAGLVAGTASGPCIRFSRIRHWLRDIDTQSVIEKDLTEHRFKEQTRNYCRYAAYAATLGPWFHLTIVPPKMSVGRSPSFQR